MAIIFGLIICLFVAAGVNGRPLRDRPALVVVDDDSNLRRIATAFTYDSAGRVLSLIETTGFPDDISAVRSIAATYDAFGRVTQQIQELGNGPTAGVRDTAQWSYDSQGRAAGVLRIHEELQFSFVFVTFASFAYDDDDRLVQKLESVDMDVDGSVDGARRTIHFYNSGQLASTLTGVHIPPLAELSVQTISAYDYDDQQRLIRQRDYITLPDGTPRGAFDRNITYDEGGRPRVESYAADVDLNGDLETITTTTSTYDAFDDLVEEHIVTEFASTRRDEQVSAFTYDSQRRLIKRELTVCCEFPGHWTITYFY